MMHSITKWNFLDVNKLYSIEFGTYIYMHKTVLISDQNIFVYLFIV